MSDTNKERLLSIDAAKGIGITLMFLGHMQIREPRLAFIYSFHMPLFVMISGFLFRTDKTIGTSLKRRAKTLLLPAHSYCPKSRIYFHPILFPDEKPRK